MIDSPGEPSRRGRFVAALVDDITRETVRAVAGELGWQSADVIEGGPDMLASLITDVPPDFLLVDVSDRLDPVGDLERLAVHCGPDTRVVVVGLQNDVALYRRLLGMGVSDYLVKPVSGDVLAEAIHLATRPTPAAGASAPPAPANAPKAARVVAMIGARGGVGATALAVSAAWCLAREKRVLLLDLDLHFGSAALNLDLEPARGLREILANPDRIDSLLIGSATTRAGERFGIMGGEDPLEDAFDLQPAGLSSLVEQVSEATDCILIDTPRSLGPLSRHVLAVADVIVIVTDQSLAAMRDTRRLVSLARTQKGAAHILGVANRVGGVAGEVGKADFERGADHAIDVSIPFDAKAAAAAAERGKSLAEVARASATAAALDAMTLALTGEAAPIAAKASFLEKWFGK
jgi:pilus assembly protein CpaE